MIQKPACNFLVSPFQAGYITNLTAAIDIAINLYNTYVTKWFSSFCFVSFLFNKVGCSLMRLLLVPSPPLSPYLVAFPIFWAPVTVILIHDTSTAVLYSV